MEKTDLLKAESYCARAEHCEAEVRQMLERHQVDDADSDAILTHLREQGYVDDYRYCRAFVHDKVAYQGWGRMKLRAALRAKHLPDDAINEAIENIDETVYRRQIERLVNQKRVQDRDRLIRFLLQRGFTYEDIRYALPQ